jgi:hypothetical protein
MRIRVLVTSLILAACAAGIGYAAEQREVADFRMVVAFDPANNEVVLKCTAGCAWTDLKFSCSKGGECSSPVDEYGMAE